MAQQLAAGYGAAPAHSDRGVRTVRRLTTSTATFSILAIAFAISTSYQVYRSTIMEIPEDDFTLATAAGYAAMVGISALALTRRRWAWWIVSTFVLGLLAFGTFYYFPEVTTARDMGPIDWLEASAFMGMLAIAEFICVLELSGAHLVTGRAGEIDNG
jgi:4-hydroxybenzoate polyprenyltransferase